MEPMVSRGFAVVAGEIGKLAEDSAKSVLTTKELINNTIEEITKYKISIKPALKLIDINNFMIKEFNR